MFSRHSGMLNFPRHALAQVAGFASLAAILWLSACGGADGDNTGLSAAERVQSESQYSVLDEALVASDLRATLSGTGPFTLFAPTDAAFALLLGELGLTKAQLHGNLPLLTTVLRYHVVSGRVLQADIVAGQAVTTRQGQTLSVGADLFITDQRTRRSAIAGTDLFTSNGVIHTLARVLLPT